MLPSQHITGAPTVSRLLVITGVTHYRHRGDLWAYGPYVREIQIWADLFPEVRLAAVCRDEPPPADCVPLARPNFSISPKLEAGGTDVLSKLRYLWGAPVLAWQLISDLVWADAVHIRNPANLAFLGLVLAPLFSRRMVSKYAGQWVSYPGEAFSVRLQRALLSSRWWRGPVTVYGKWPAQPAHVIPFFTSATTEAQLERAKIASALKRFEGPLRVLFVGRLSRSKNVDVLLSAVALANKGGSKLTCGVVGVGPELDRLRRLAGELGIENDVEFLGGIDHDGVMEQLERAHILVLVSETEGWPKALVEAMACGLICIASNRGLVPQLLDRNRGFVVPAGDVDSLAAILAQIAANPEDYASVSRAAAAWAQGFSLERLRDELRVLLEKEWKCRLADASVGA